MAKNKKSGSYDKKNEVYLATALFKKSLCHMLDKIWKAVPFFSGAASCTETFSSFRPHICARKILLQMLSKSRIQWKIVLSRKRKK